MTAVNAMPAPGATRQVLERGERHVLLREGRWFRVRDLDGKLVSGSCQSAPTAWSVFRRLENAGRNTRRTCLCCGGDFMSEGIHNRLCNRCRQVGLGREMWR